MGAPIMPRPTKPSLSCDMLVILFEVLDFYCLLRSKKSG
jgi:hypothetical protein